MQTFALDQPSKIPGVSAPSSINKTKWNQPFPSVMPFPIKRSAPIQHDNNTMFGNQSNDEDVVANLPSYLPPYPPSHTYKRTRKRTNPNSKSNLNTNETTTTTEKNANANKKNKIDHTNININANTNVNSNINAATSISSTAMASAASRDVQHALSVLEESV